MWPCLNVLFFSHQCFPSCQNKEGGKETSDTSMPLRRGGGWIVSLLIKCLDVVGGCPKECHRCWCDASEPKYLTHEKAVARKMGKFKIEHLITEFLHTHTHTHTHTIVLLQPAFLIGSFVRQAGETTDPQWVSETMF